VPSESVGAIIGKGGQTIRQLTQQTRAKVDVYRGDPMAPTTALQEKVITIRGQPENCINACREILKVMKADAESKGKPSDTPLKVLAHNDYIGRIIGKQGNIINTIKKETETSVTVSSINDMSMNVERVITVKGDLENMIKALEIIHSKIKSAFENDTKTYGAQAIMMGGIPPIPLAPPAFASSAAAAAAAAAFNAGPSSAARFAAAAAAAAAQAQQHGHLANGHHNPHHNGQANGAQPATHSGGSNGSQSGQFQNFYPPMYQPHPGHPHQMSQYQGQNMLPQQQQQPGQPGAQQGSQHLGQQQDFVNQGPEPETVYLYIPNVAVGAIIGTKGSFIKNIIKLSGASVKITPLTPEESKNVVERQVVIVGTPDSQWKAQYYIYEKIRQERFATDENVKLRAELQVPAHIVGRIIGKSGKNVRELQRNTGATIKLPEDAALLQQQNQENNANTSNTEESNSLEAATIEVKKSEEDPAVVTEPASVEQSTEATIDPTGTDSAENKSESSNAGTPQQVNTAGYVVVRIFGTFQASQLAQRRIQALVIQSIRGFNPLDNQMIMGAHRNSLNNITNHQMEFQMPMMMSTFSRTEYQQPQPRLNGGGNGYNRRNNRNHQQKGDQQHHHQQQQITKDMNGVQQPVMTNGNSNGVEEPIVEQLNQLNIKQEQTPITA